MFNILDALILLFVIICVLVGMRRGLIGSLAKLLGGVLRIVVAILLAKPFVSLIKTTMIDERMFDGLLAKFSSVSDKFNINLVGMEATELSTFVGDALSDAKIPKVFRGFFINVLSINPEAIALRESVTMAELMAVAVLNVILLCLSFVVLLLLLWLVSKLVVKWSKGSVRNDTVFAKTNKWLGLLFGLIKSLLIVFLIFIAISFLKDFSFMQGIVQFVNGSFLGRLLLKVSQALIDSSFNLKEVLEKWLIKS